MHHTETSFQKLPFHKRFSQKILINENLEQFLEIKLKFLSTKIFAKSPRINLVVRKKRRKEKPQEA